MNTTQNTVLITGGSAGIGFAIARELSERGNQVIITGRNKERLQQAAAQLKNTTAIVSDVSKEEDRELLVNRLQKEFPNLNIVINNAGHVYAYQLSATADASRKAGEEMQTNYLSVIGLNELLLPLLSRQKEAAIVNTSSIVALVPAKGISTYSASKAALHSYTQSLRLALTGTTGIKVFELMPPLVNTDFSKEIGGEKGIPPQAVAESLLTALENDEYEIHVGGTAEIYKLSLSSPADALAAMNSRN